MKSDDAGSRRNARSETEAVCKLPAEAQRIAARLMQIRTASRWSAPGFYNQSDFKAKPS
jgi:hypothetical protein